MKTMFSLPGAALPWNVETCWHAGPGYGAAGREVRQEAGVLLGPSCASGRGLARGLGASFPLRGDCPPRVLDAGPAHPTRAGAALTTAKGAPAITEPGGGNGDNQGDGTGEGPILGPDSRGTPRQRRRDAGDRRRVEADRDGGRGAPREACGRRAGPAGLRDPPCG